jgi:hypothetical protein
MRSVVVLPQPDGPSSVTKAASGMPSDRRCTAVKSPKRFTMSLRSTALTRSSRKSGPAAGAGPGRAQ